jgi:IstB-like ATP binding protein
LKIAGSPVESRMSGNAHVRFGGAGRRDLRSETIVWRSAPTLHDPASKVGAELQFDVISTAYERTSLMVTTNLPFESWTEVLGSERLTGATLDRLTHRCQIIETRGESYRLRDAKARVRKPEISGGAGPAKGVAAAPPEAMEGGPRTR